MIDAPANPRPLPAEKQAAPLNISPLSTTIESNADNFSRRWSLDNRSETPSRLSVTTHLFKYFGRRSQRGGGDAQESSLNDLREELRSVRREFEDLVCQLDQARQEIKAREAQLGRYEQTNEYCQRLLQRNSDLELMIGRVQDEFQDRLAEYEKLIDEKHSAIDSLRSESRRNADSDAQTRQQLESVQKAHRALQTQYTAASDRISSLNGELSSLKEELNSALADKTGLEKGHKTLRAEYESFRDLYQKQLAQISSTGESVKDVLRENMGLHTEKLSLQNLHRELEAKNASLRQSLQEARAESRRLADDASNKQTQLDTIYASYERLKQSLVAITGLEDGIPMPAGTTIESVVALRSQLDALRSELSEKDQRHQIRVNELEVSNMRMKEQLKNYEQVHETASTLLKRNGELERALGERVATGSLEKLLASERRKSEASAVSLRKAQQEIKTLEAHILALHKQLNEQLAGAATPGAERALQMLDKNFIDSLKNEHSEEIKALHAHYQAELARLRQEEQQLASKNLAHSLETRERELRAKFVEEFDQRLQQAERAADAHYKQTIETLDLQNKNRIAELKRELVNTKQKYDDMLRALSAEYDEKMLSAANEMESVMRAKDNELGQTRSALMSTRTQKELLEQELASLKRRFEDLSSSYKKELLEIHDRAKKVEFAPRASIENSERRGGDLDRLVQNLKAEFEQEKKRLLSRIKEVEVNSEAHLAETIKLQRQKIELESQVEIQSSELQTLRSELAQSQKLVPVDMVSGLLTRNKELEETIAILSNKVHDTLRDRERDALRSSTRRQTLQVVEVESASSINLIQNLQHKITELELTRSQLTASLARTDEPKATAHGDETAGTDRLKEIYDQLLAKLELLSKSVQEGLDMDRQTREASAQLVERQVDRLKAQKTVELLQAARDQRIETIKKLEAELQTARAEQFKPHLVEHQNDNYERLYQKVAAERDGLEDANRRLKNAVEDKTKALQEELKIRDEQLRLLEETKSTLSNLLGRNKQLEVDLQELFQQAQNSAAPKTNFERLEQMMIALESHNSAVHEAHGLEVLRLQQSITERETEYRNLDQEHRKLEVELQDAEKLKLQLMEQEWSAKLASEAAETERLRDLIKKLEHDYQCLQTTSKSSLEDADSRFQELVKTISSQLTQNDLIIADIQDQKNSEIETIKTALQASLDAQNMLAAEIESVRRKLEARSAEYQRTEEDLKRLLQELGSGLTTGADIKSDEAVRSLRERFQALVRELQKSEREGDKLRQYFDALIRRQESEISLAREQKSLLQPSLDPVEDQKIMSQLNTLETALLAHNTATQQNARSLEHFRSEFAGLADLQQGMARINELSAKSHEGTVAAIEATHGSSFASRALNTIVHRVHTLMKTIESRATTANTDVDCAPSGSGKRRLDQSPDEINKRPRV